MFGIHTSDMRQPTIIRLLAAAGCLLAVTAAPSASAQTGRNGTPGACVSCLILQVPAASAAVLSTPPDSLAGLTVVVDAREPAASAAIRRLHDAGAIAGLVMAAGSHDPDLLIREADVLVILDPSDDAAAVFDLRTLASSARAARRGVRILAEATAASAGIEAYTDGRVSRGPHRDTMSADELAAASREARAEPVLVRLETVDWTAVTSFASQRAFGTAVTAEAPMDIARIVARHQAWQRRQAQLVRRTIARGTTTLMFEVPGFMAPVTVTAETVIYRRPETTEMEQRDIRVNGVSIAGANASSAPKLPLIEAERVATPPLAIVLNDAYVYSLDALERVDGADAYVVGFAPRSGNRGLASGHAWIDARTFGLRRLEIVQRGLRGAIVSSEQHEEFGRFAVGEETVWLPVRTRVFQMYEGAGHRTPVHRTIETPEYVINPEDFDRRLHAAYSSPHLMLRETPHGYRYLLRSAASGTDAASREVAPRAGERVRTAVFGLLVDPNMTVPLPFAGISYVDLNLLNTGAQLNGFFGGTYGQLSWSVPSLGGTRWQAHGRAFAIAARYNDRSFRGGVEQYRENITQRPAHVSAGFVRLLAGRMRTRVDYQLDYTSFDRADTTDPAFVIPANAIVHGLMASLEGESGPWAARMWWSPAVRQHWRAWGIGDLRFEDARAFQRFGAAVARTLALGQILTSRVEAEWVDGVDLDRFSRYSVGAFENRVHGYPTASLRYDRGIVVRTSASWTARGWRIDTFADLAAVRDPGFGRDLRTYPGVGAALEVGGPFDTLWSLDWGYGFRARRSDGRLGTQAVRVTGFRTF